MIGQFEIFRLTERSTIQGIVKGGPFLGMGGQ